MKSTGEAMGVDRLFGVAFYKAQESVGNKLPLKGGVFLSLRDEDKSRILASVNILDSLGFTFYGTRGTAQFFEKHGISVTSVNKQIEGEENTVTLTWKSQFQFILNVADKRDVTEGYYLRRAAFLNRIPYVTTVRGFDAIAEALKCLHSTQGGYDVRSLGEWIS